MDGFFRMSLPLVDIVGADNLGFLFTNRPNFRRLPNRRKEGSSARGITIILGMNIAGTTRAYEAARETEKIGR